MQAAKGLNLALRFLLELASLAALAWWGFTVDAGWFWRLLFGLGAPALFAVVWGTLLSPKARVSLGLPIRLGLEALLFAAVALALVAVGQPLLGLVFAVLAVVNRILMLVWEQ